MGKKEWLSWAFVSAVVLLGLNFTYSNFNGGISGHAIDFSREEENVVYVENFEFSPEVLEIEVGESVTWINLGDQQYCVAFENISDSTSAVLSKGDTFSYEFSEEGIFEYYCKMHPFVRGEVIVNNG